MENKKLGIVLLIFSLTFMVFLIYFNNSLGESSDKMNCLPTEECVDVYSSLNITNFGFGFFGFMFGLGVYLLIFNKGSEKILKKIEEERKGISNEERFKIVLKVLNPYERKVVEAIKEQDGITQNVLRIRTDLSKAKLSYVLQDLEKRGIIKRVEKGKSLSIFLRI